MLVTSIFFFNDTATTEIYTLSLHDALPIWTLRRPAGVGEVVRVVLRLEHVQHVRPEGLRRPHDVRDRKSTRLNSSHANISYAVFCLKKKIPISTHTPYSERTTCS